MAEPDVKHRGYQSNAYPASPASKEVMALVWDVAELPALIAALDNLFLWFRDEIGIKSGLITK